MTGIKNVFEALGAFLLKVLKIMAVPFIALYKNVLQPLVQKVINPVYSFIEKGGFHSRFIFDMIYIVLAAIIASEMFTEFGLVTVLFILVALYVVVKYILRHINGKVLPGGPGVHLAVLSLLSIFLLPQFAGINVALFLFVPVGETLVFAINKLREFLKETPDFKATESVGLVNVAGSIMAIVIGLLFGFILMLFVNPINAFPGFFTILQGGFRDLNSIGNMIYLSVPIILTGLAVAFAFRTGLFNIGASGQMTMGAFTAVYIGVEWGFLGELIPGFAALHWLVAVFGAIIAGALWGMIPGLLKAYRNVNEVVASIMLNYVAMYINVMLIVNLIYNQEYARAKDIVSSAATPTLNLDFLFQGSSINGGIVVAILVVILLYVILNKTTFGYELKAVGLNRDASKYAGMNSKRNIVLSMVISGAIAGLAGAMTFLVIGKHLKPEAVILAEGFTGIAISLLGLSNPIGVLLAGLFYGSLQQGGYYMQLFDFKPEIIDIIIAVIIYASALGLFLQKFVINALRKREMEIETEPLVEENEVGGEN